MRTCEIWFGGKLLSQATSFAKLENVLESSRQELGHFTPIIFLIHENGNSLSVGISPVGYYLNFYNELEKAFYSSLPTDRSLTDSEFVWFQMSAEGHASEVPSKYLVSWEEALLAAKSFFMRGTPLVDSLSWEMD